MSQVYTVYVHSQEFPVLPKAVIFDVDGTLYNQQPLRRKMLVALLGHYALRPWRWRELRILSRFRAEREKRPGAVGPDLENAQYAWCGYPAAQVRPVIQRWIFNHPNQYLAACAYPGVQDFFAALRHRGIKIGIYSDYPAQAKLAALGLTADAVVSSTDAAVDRLKPDPAGLLSAARQLGVAPAECLFIGDRPELDGECARRAHMPFLLVDELATAPLHFYQALANQLSLPTA